MRILSWNCQGVGNTPTVRHLREICGQYFPEVIFLCETKKKRSYLENVVGHLGYYDLHTVEPAGLSGGLALMWKDSVSVKIIQSDDRLIDAAIKWQDKEFFLTCVYGDPVRSERGKVWERLSRIGVNRKGPWMMTGDFNELVDPAEKKGGPVRPEASCVEFRQMLKACGVWEIKHVGYQFSWFGNRNDELVQCRLDRTVANQEWTELFPQAKALYLQRTCSDHSPLINNLLGVNWKTWASFKYDQRWIGREGFKEVVEGFWKQRNPDLQAPMAERLASCRKQISQWKRLAQPDSAKRIQELHNRIDLITKQTPFRKADLRKLREELNEEYLREETFWKQKSRALWMHGGDRNTKFFHATTKNRRAQNRIKSLMDDREKEWFAEKDLGRIAEEYFKKLYASEDIGYKLQELTQEVHSVSSEMNRQLLSPVSKEEVRRATFEINPNKSPGPDGLTGYFFQQFWDCMGDDITTMVREFFRTGVMEKDINKTNICLIPKKMNVVKLSEFRPISLCNVVYKIIAKLLAKRLKKVLPQVISETQSAFIEGRAISDNILVAHELLHALNSNNLCSEEFVAIKTDISKAYDRVEWSFLEGALEMLGFADEWILLVMQCVKTVSYQVLINGTPYGNINPTRGLRQGDPLSPYLFVICTEVLVRMLKKAEEKNEITGLKVARTAPPVSHLLFADDSMFYCKQEDEELNHIVRIIEEYSLASGQRVNYQKSSVYFGKSIPVERRSLIKKKLGISQEGGKGVYLGLPESFGGAKVETLSFLKERIQQKISGWQTNFISPGGKEVLLKAVAMALPTYTMSCFLLPKTVCKQIVSVLSDFWWKNNKDSRGMHWKAWEHLSKPKAEGGIGFKDIETFNIALLGKQLWRMLTCENTLMAKVFKGRYFYKSDPLNAPLGSRPSFAWKSIHASQELIKQGARAVIGNGNSINIWRSQWVGTKPATAIFRTKKVSHNHYSLLSSLLNVKDLLDENCREWRRDILDTVFPEEERRVIEELRPGGRATLDNYSWDYTKSGAYTVKSGYWVLNNIISQKSSPQVVDQPNLNPIFQKIWQSQASPKVHHFLWRCLSNCISVAGNLAYRHIARDAACPRCPTSPESANHLLFQCTLARLVWAVSPIPAPPGGEWSDSLYSNMYWVLNLAEECPQAKNQAHLVPWLLWRLWKNRNELIFKDREFGVEEVLRRVKEDAVEWQKRNEGMPQKENMTASISNGKWRRPPVQWVKCNTDATWQTEGHLCGLGWVLRNEEGRAIWMGARALPKVKTVLEAELEALRWAVITLSSFHYKKIIFESDAKTLIDLLNGDEDWPSLRPSLQDIRMKLHLFEEVKFSFTPRGGNNVADRVARESLSFSNYDPKLYSIVPRWLKNTVELEYVM